MSDYAEHLAAAGTRIDEIVEEIVTTLRGRGYTCKVQVADSTLSQYVWVEREVWIDDYTLDEEATVEGFDIRVSDHPGRRDCEAKIHIRLHDDVQAKIAHLN